MSHSQFHSKKEFILTHAWLNLWDKHMTTGRINQVAILRYTCNPKEGRVFRICFTQPKIDVQGHVIHVILHGATRGWDGARERENKYPSSRTEPNLVEGDPQPPRRCLQ